MVSGLLVQLRPTTPWRIAPDSGARDRVGTLFHSDSLYSALTHAMGYLGQLEDWLSATAAAQSPAVRFTSCFPFVEGTLLVTPPRNLWPPPPSPRVRWKGARYVPLSVVEKLLKEPDGRLKEDEGWVVDSASECLLPPPRRGKAQAPFRVTVRRSAAVDRFTGTAGEAVATACLEFSEGSGLWTCAAFANEESRERWMGPVKAAFRLLSDSGFGGQRSRGWGRAAAPEFRQGGFPDLLLAGPTEIQPVAAPAGEEGEPVAETAPAYETGYWLLSMFRPAESDVVDWNRGAYSVVERAGRVDSPAASGAVKKSVRMVTEGSVVLAAGAPQGSVADVAPDGFAHPVYRSGHVLSIPISWRVVA
ncbi:MAG: hypothetical protein JNK48_23750 [Bryobacterales bacterium]|nr:hypothetical protein [Bryobacterales bacterium]